MGALVDLVVQAVAGISNRAFALFMVLLVALSCVLVAVSLF